MYELKDVTWEQFIALIEYFTELKESDYTIKWIKTRLSYVKKPFTYSTDTYPDCRYICGYVDALVNSKVIPSWIGTYVTRWLASYCGDCSHEGHYPYPEDCYMAKIFITKDYDNI